jgi:hypothetical protein
LTLIHLMIISLVLSIKKVLTLLLAVSNRRLATPHVGKGNRNESRSSAFSFVSNT